MGNRLIPASCALALLFLTACDPGKLGKLKTAIADLDVSGPLTCELYTTKGRGLAERAWREDWHIFEPILAMPPDAEDIEQFCRDYASSLGIITVTKPDFLHSSTALSFLIALAPNFESKDSNHQAATYCHETVHAAWQKRAGLKMAIADYITVSGRLSVEAVAYALGDLILLKLGVSQARVDRERFSRSLSFPENYKLDRIVEPECVYDYFTAVSNALQERTRLPQIAVAP